MCVCACVHAFMRVCVLAYVRACVHACVCASVHACVCLCVNNSTVKINKIFMCKLNRS